MNTVRTLPVFGSRAVRLSRHFLALLACCLFLVMGLCAAPARAQDLPIYTDSLQNGWIDYSFGCTRNFENTSPVQLGTDSISCTYTAGYQGLSLHNNTPLNTAGYSALSFWINGGTAGGQTIMVLAQRSSGASTTAVPLKNYLPGGGVPANTWVHVQIPLTDLQAANVPDFNNFWLQEFAGTAEPTFYIDTISLINAPAIVNVTVQAAQSGRVIDNRLFGINTAMWDSNLGTATTLSLMTAAGVRFMRFPGGSNSDFYDWTNQGAAWESTTTTFAGLIGAAGAQTVITTNYGSGSPQMAAAWVAYCNAATANATSIGTDSAGRNWYTASYWAALRGATPLQTDDGMNFLRANHPNPYGFKYWEIGNEVYGSWEEDNHAVPHDPITYASVTQAATALMKQVDPTIKIGVVISPGEDDYGISTETVTNPVTGVKHSGWTPVLFSTLNGQGYVPDFVIDHKLPTKSRLGERRLAPELRADVDKLRGEYPEDADGLLRVVENGEHRIDLHGEQLGVLRNGQADDEFGQRPVLLRVAGLHSPDGIQGVDVVGPPQRRSHERKQLAQSVRLARVWRLRDLGVGGRSAGGRSKRAVSDVFRAETGFSLRARRRYRRRCDLGLPVAERLRRPERRGRLVAARDQHESELHGEHASLAHRLCACGDGGDVSIRRNGRYAAVDGGNGRSDPGDTLGGRLDVLRIVPAVLDDGHQT